MLDGTLRGRVVALSRWYATAPIPVSDQPPYINGVALMAFPDEAPVDPAALLAALMRIEAACGRQRGVPNAARTLDLDLIAITAPGGPILRVSSDPVLPHPRAHLRAFVLAPILDVDPGWKHPVLGTSAKALLAGLDSQECQALPDRERSGYGIGGREA
jgi:2-amino-4-hydroxy-6-hydroxymethyldihydropteridine diphosphokinase